MAAHLQPTGCPSALPPSARYIERKQMLFFDHNMTNAAEKELLPLKYTMTLVSGDHMLM